MTKSISETLYAAADLLEGEGRWTQGQWLSINGCMCAEGAIYAAVGAQAWNSHPVGDKAVDFLSAMLPKVPGNIIATWNDAPNRTQSEVVAKLREAGDRAREEGK